MPEPKLIVILGPTATGKSDLAVALARKFSGEVVSADSRQVYMGLNIGTGKITHKEMKGVRHHLLDVADPKKQFSAEKYRIQAQAAIKDILSRKKVLIICGGSGFYIDAALNAVQLPSAPANQAVRKRLAGKSPAQLIAMLKKLDRERARAMSANNSEKNNARRLIRAIEVAMKAGTFRAEIKHSSDPYNALFIGLNVSPNSLRERINTRLIRRLKAGMIAEAKRLHARGLTWKRMNELGLEYRYLALFLQGKMTHDEMIAKLNTEIWRYAKRQMTWFKRNKKIQWFKPGDMSKISAATKKFLAAN